MKKVNITYHMRNRTEIAESCITLAMKDSIAEDILENQENSQYLSPILDGEVYQLLCKLATIQGYEYKDACCPELIR